MKTLPVINFLHEICSCKILLIISGRSQITKIRKNRSFVPLYKICIKL